tara:strand:- start:35 stop:814 length:780 start_codon:yes stop_codon:yes gene_type:complete
MNKVAFTIVLNGMPFIKDQYEIIPKIFDHWYIIEGVSKNINCTRWCNPIAREYHENNLSVDGTRQFLDTINKDKKITVIRKKNGDAWNGKVEMCNSFMHLVKDCLLMQVDVDEFWSESVLLDIFKYCKTHNNFDAMQFRCSFYLGNNLVVNGKNCYGDMDWDWWRLWMIGKHNNFISHEPPRIQNQKLVIHKNDTSKAGWTFDHFAYKYKHQLEFKEKFYGYKGAVNQWEQLNSLESYENVFAEKYLKWIKTKCPIKKI